MNEEIIVHRAKRLRNGEYFILCQLPQNPITPWATCMSSTVDGKDRYHSSFYYPSQESLAYEDFEASW